MLARLVAPAQEPAAPARREAADSPRGRGTQVTTPDRDGGPFACPDPVAAIRLMDCAGRAAPAC